MCEAASWYGQGAKPAHARACQWVRIWEGGTAFWVIEKRAAAWDQGWMSPAVSSVPYFGRVTFLAVAAETFVYFGRMVGR